MNIKNKLMKLNTENLHIDEIAKEINTSYFYAFTLLKSFGKKYLKRHTKRNRKDTYNWSNVNWEKQDIVISRELGCSRERVRQQRLALNQNQSPFYHARFAKKFNEINGKILSLDTEHLSLQEISEEIQYEDKRYSRLALKNLNKKYIRYARRYRWDMADWNKSNKEIAADLGISFPQTVANYRYQRKLKALRAKGIEHQKELEKINEKSIETID